MKLWLISQDANNDYDTYDSAVVAALTAQDARKIHPSGHGDWPSERWFELWAPDLLSVKVHEIGEAAPSLEQGVICASFNAG